MKTTLMKINEPVHEKRSSMIPSRRLDTKQQVYMLMLARYLRFGYTRLVIFSANDKYADQYV